MARGIVPVKELTANHSRDIPQIAGNGVGDSQLSRWEIQKNPAHAASRDPNESWETELEFLSGASSVSFIIFLDWCRLLFRPEGDEDFPRGSVSSSRKMKNGKSPHPSCRNCHVLRYIPIRLLINSLSERSLNYLLFHDLKQMFKKGIV